MKINQAGLEIIKRFEGLRLKAYKCSAGVWTIGWGHTRDPYTGQLDVKPGMRITQHQAEVILQLDLEQRFEKDVSELTEGLNLNENEFSALVSFAFNCGSDIDADELPEGLGDSTLLRKLKAGDKQGAANEFLKWIRSAGKVERGLVLRREAERALFLKP